MNKAVIGTVIGCFFAAQTRAGTLYVDLNSGSPQAPYSSWATAATDIQDAVDAAASNDTVFVTNGVYASGGALTVGLTTNRVAIAANITVRSVNGPDVTIIEGHAAKGEDAVRCAYVGTNALLSGFTLTEGATQTTGDDNESQSGGGAWCESSAVLSNCVITGNSATRYGGGVYQGTVTDCSISGNTSATGAGSAYATVSGSALMENEATTSGGGAYECTMSNCTLAGNSADYYGGGSFYGTLNNCVLTNNTADSGGGSYYGTLNNCTLTDNRVIHDGGGAQSSVLNHCILIGNQAGDDAGGCYYGTLDNCLLIGNSAADWAGGSYNATLNNCTVSGNSAGDRAGGTYSGTLNNCIVYGNTGGDGDNYYPSSGTFNFSCTTPLPAGAGNISGDPEFVEAGSGNYHLLDTSPAIDSGSNIYVSASSDLDGEERISHGTVDMGAYEWTPLPWWILTSASQLQLQVAVDNPLISETFELWNAGTSNMSYSISDNVPWMEVSPAGGSSTGEQHTVTILFDTEGLSVGSYTGSVSIASPDAVNSPRAVEVVLEVYAPQLDHFQWSDIGVIQPAGEPIAVSITAKDENGYDVPSFTGTADLCAVVEADAMDVDVGDASGEWEFPMHAYYHDSRTQVIYLSSEIGSAGRITTVALNVKTLPTMNLGNWTIRMLHTPLTAYGESPEWESDWTVVYQADETISSTGWVEFELSTPFEYNGSDNLMVDFSHNNIRYDDSGICYATDSGAARTVYYYSDSHDGDPLDWSDTSPTPETSTMAPDIRFGMEPSALLSILPANTGTFAAGKWTGSITMETEAAGVVLLAEEADGHTGLSNPFHVAVWTSGADTDGDGILDYDEVLAGTSITDSSDCFRMTSVSNSSSVFTVYFQSLAERRYELTGCSNLVEGIWFPVPGAELRMGVGGPDSMSDTNRTPSSRFYRLEVSLP
jgi:hypothetical protein